MNPQQATQSYQLLRDKHAKKEISIEELIDGITNLGKKLDRHFEGARVNGREFPFVRVTVTGSATILKKFNPSLCKIILQLISFQWARPSGKDKRWWKKLRSVAFVKTGLWKWFRIVPKELRCSEITQHEAWEIEESFFVYAGATVNERGVLSLSAKPSQIRKSEIK
jgi:hypothetical protein